MKKSTLAAIVVVAAVLGAYSWVVVADQPKTASTEEIKQLVQDFSLGAKQAKAASITSHQLVVTQDDDSRIAFDLPKDEFFVSIAPYIYETHPCATHSLTGCRGEMENEAFRVYIEDEEKNVVFNGTATSNANGFIDLWLPRDKTYRVEIEKDGKAQEAELSTFQGDDTCVTTIQLVDAEKK
ncbi:CueP family metal-binding protein [Paenibacillus sp. TRM 82003]|nr:CueP family metal-binding protein [Paenibacillus sp. TRM 82003]